MGFEPDISKFLFRILKSQNLTYGFFIVIFAYCDVFYDLLCMLRKIRCRLHNISVVAYPADFFGKDLF